MAGTVWMSAVFIFVFYLSVFQCVSAMPISATLLQEALKRFDVRDLQDKMIPLDFLLILVMVYFGKKLREQNKKLKWEKKYRKRPFLDPAEDHSTYYTFPQPGPREKVVQIMEEVQMNRGIKSTYSDPATISSVDYTPTTVTLVPYDPIPATFD